MIVLFPGRERMDLTSKNAAVFMLTCFCGTLLVLSLGVTGLSIRFPVFAALASDLWKSFTATYSALFIVLNVSGNAAPPPPPPPPATPAGV